MARFNAPPGWDQPPAGFTPPPNWQPAAHWPPAPQNWPFWVDDYGQPTAPPPGAWAGPSNFGGQPQGQPSAPQFQPSAPGYQQQGPQPGGYQQGQPQQQWGGAQQPPGAYAGQPAPQPKKKTGLIIGIVGAVVALALIAGAVFFVLNQEPKLSTSDVSAAYTSGLKLGSHTFKLDKETPTSGSSTNDDGTCGLNTKRFADKADATIDGKEDATTAMSSASTIHFTDIDPAHKALEEYAKKFDNCSSDGVTVKVTKKSLGSKPGYANFSATTQGMTINGTMVQWGNTLTLVMAMDSVDGEQVAKDIKDQFKKS